MSESEEVQDINELDPYAVDPFSVDPFKVEPEKGRDLSTFGTVLEAKSKFKLGRLNIEVVEAEGEWRIQERSEFIFEISTLIKT